MRLFILIFSTILIMTNIPNASASGFARIGTYGFQWEGLFSSSRLASMGGSDMADSGPGALMINPAPLARGNQVVVGYSGGKFLSEFEFSTYAAGIEWQNFRINFASESNFADNLIVHTAYNPEGIGQINSVRNRMTVYGASYDLGRGLIKHPSLQWSVGFSIRHYSSTLDSSSSETDSHDLGSSLSWTFHYPKGWTRITGSVSDQNISNSSFNFDEREIMLPDPMRIGLTVETAFKRSDHPGNFLKLLVAFTRAHNFHFSDQFGLEALVYDTVALRWGHSQRFEDGISSWGIGLVLDRDFLGPFTVQMDFGMMNFDSELLSDSKAVWGLRTGYQF